MRTIPFGKPLLGNEERQAVNQVLQGTVLVHGPKAKEFEKAFAQFTGAPCSISLASCTAGLHLAYFSMGIGLGAEVIVPSQTHVATAHAVELTGARPVFVDSEALTGNIDISRIEEKITPRTRALSVVHYLGMPVNMDAVMAIAKKHRLFVVEDCALALGTRYKGTHAGLHGDVGCFSFYPVKHITTSEGGMLITRNSELASKINRQKAFGLDRTVMERAVPGLYDVDLLGLNYRMSEIEAVLGIEQLKRLPGFLDRRAKNYQSLSEALRGVPEISLFESSRGDFLSSYYCHSIILCDALAPKRFDLVKFLNERGVGTSIYYPKAVPHFTYYQKKYGYSDREFPVASRISDHSIAFPVGPHLDQDDMHYIATTLKEGIKAVSK